MLLIDGVLRPVEKIKHHAKRLALSKLRPGKIYTLEGKNSEILVVCLNGKTPTAFRAQCPHMGADLSEAKCIG